MKKLLFNIYKVSYINVYKDSYEKFPNHEAGFIGQCAASAGVFLFLSLIYMDVYLPISIICKFGPSNIDKPLMWICMLVGVYLCHVLLFKILGLEPHNYCAPEYKPDQQTIRRTWTVYAIVGAITAILIALQLYLRKW